MMDGVEQKDPGGVAERKRVPGRCSPVVQSNGSDAIGTAIRAKSRIPGVGLDEIARKCAEPEFSRFREGDRRPRKPPRKRGWTPEERKRNAKNLGHRRPVCRVVFPSLNPCPIARQRLPSRRLGTRAPLSQIHQNASSEFPPPSWLSASACNSSAVPEQQRKHMALFRLVLSHAHVSLSHVLFAARIGAFCRIGQPLKIPISTLLKFS